MIQSLLGFCLRERLVVFLFCVVVVAYGWHCTQEVPLDAEQTKEVKRYFSGGRFDGVDRFYFHLTSEGFRY